MNTTKEQIDDLNAVISIAIEPEDYHAKVNEILKDYRRKANIPGFRKGFVPEGMVRKMYGEAVLAEEVNKMLSGELYDYISREKIETLGQPIPNKDETATREFKLGNRFEFKFDIGVQPQFEVTIAKMKLDYYTIKIDDELIDKYVKDMARRFGSMRDVDMASADCMVNGVIHETDSTGAEIPGGIHSHSSIAIEYLEKETSKKMLAGKKIDDVLFPFLPADFSKGDADLAALMSIDRRDLDLLKDKHFSFSIKKIHELTPAENGQSLWDKVFGEGAVDSETAFRAKLAEELKKSLIQDSDRLMVKHLQDQLKEKLKLKLPDDFLKRWLAISNEKATAEDIEKEYGEFAEGLKLQLIEKQIAKENGIDVSFEEALDRTKILFRAQMASYGTQVSDEEIHRAAENYLAKNEDSRRIFDQIFFDKLLNLYKETIVLKNKEVTFDEFVKLATGKTPKKGIFEQISNLVKL
jgi:trigger factor